MSPSLPKLSSRAERTALSSSSASSSASSWARRRLLLLLALGAGVGGLAGALPLGSARAQKPAAAPATATKPAAEAPKCKTWGPKPVCCDPAIAAHLTKEAVYSACGESDATFLGEQGSKETCKYFFKVEGQKEEDTFVSVYAPTQKEVLASPNDPFFQYKKVGKVYMTEKAKSPKMMAMIINSTGLYMPGKGYSVSVNASTKVCDKGQAKRLAGSMK